MFYHLHVIGKKFQPGSCRERSKCKSFVTVSGLCDEWRRTSKFKVEKQFYLSCAHNFSLACFWDDICQQHEPLDSFLNAPHEEYQMNSKNAEKGLQATPAKSWSLHGVMWLLESPLFPYLFHEIHTFLSV